MPTKLNPKTIIPSLNPHPEIDIGINTSKITIGTIIKRKLQGTIIFNDNAIKPIESTVKTCMEIDNIINVMASCVFLNT